jgi:hypothetical protein
MFSSELIAIPSSLIEKKFQPKRFTREILHDETHMSNLYVVEASLVSVDGVLELFEVDFLRGPRGPDLRGFERNCSNESV